MIHTGTVVNETVLATGFSFPEGPCCDPDGTLHVTELANRCISKVADGRRIVVAEVGGSPNGAAFAENGDLYIANGGGRWGPNASTDGPGLSEDPGFIQCLARDGTCTTVVAEIDGIPLNAPNDIVFDDAGGFYFTDPVWPPRASDHSPDLSQVTAGSLGYGTIAGMTRRVNRDILFPNGLQVAPDGRSLVVGETGTGRVYRFPIVAPGRLGAREVYADLGSETWPDGMCFDSFGRLIVVGYGTHRLFVVTPGGGAVQRTIELEDADVTNACFGGSDFRTLYVTQASLGRIVTLRWDCPGMRLFPDRHWQLDLG